MLSGPFSSYVHHPQAYDLSVKIEKDPSLISDKAREISKWRQDWAKRLEEESDRRRAAYKEKLLQQEKLRESIQKAPKVDEDELVSEMVESMFAKYPALAAKREHAMKVNTCFAVRLTSLTVKSGSANKSERKQKHCARRRSALSASDKACINNLILHYFSAIRYVRNA